VKLENVDRWSFEVLTLHEKDLWLGFVPEEGRRLQIWGPHLPLMGLIVVKDHMVPNWHRSSSAGFLVFYHC